MIQILPHLFRSLTRHFSHNNFHIFHEKYYLIEQINKYIIPCFVTIYNITTARREQKNKIKNKEKQWKIHWQSDGCNEKKKKLEKFRFAADRISSLTIEEIDQLIKIFNVGRVVSSRNVPRGWGRESDLHKVGGYVHSERQRWKTFYPWEGKLNV